MLGPLTDRVHAPQLWLGPDPTEFPYWRFPRSWEEPYAKDPPSKYTLQEYMLNNGIPTYGRDLELNYRLNAMLDGWPPRKPAGHRCGYDLGWPGNCLHPSHGNTINNGRIGASTRRRIGEWLQGVDSPRTVPNGNDSNVSRGASKCDKVKDHRKAKMKSKTTKKSMTGKHAKVNKIDAKAKRNHFTSINR